MVLPGRIEEVGQRNKRITVHAQALVSSGLGPDPQMGDDVIEK